MPTIALVAVGALDEDGRVAEAFGENLAANIVKADTLADVTPRLLYHGIPINIREETKAEALRIAWIRKAIHRDGGL